MYDFLVENPMYVVFLVVFTIWLGIAWFLFSLNGKITRLERTTQVHDRT